METALSTISILPSTKQQRESFVNMAIMEFTNGNIKALPTYLAYKGAFETLKDIVENKRVKDLAFAESEKEPEKTFEYGNFEITKSGKTTYQWKDYNDSILQEMFLEQDLLKKRIEARQKTILSGVDPSSGETFSPVPFDKPEFLIVKLVK